MDAAATGSTIQSHKSDKGGLLPAYSVHMDAIRAFAAFLVLAGHARMLFFGDHQAHGPSTGTTVKNLGLGHHAVIVFFVLSGFLVGNSAWRAVQSGRWSWRKYLLQRMTRLWIVLLPALFIGGVLDHVGMHFLSHDQGIYTGPAGQGMVASTLPADSTARVFAGNAVFLQTIHVPNFGTNSALWSLANEFWYYMAFPLLLLAFFGNIPAWRKVLFAALAVAILVFVGPKIAALFAVWLLGFAVSVLPLKIPDRSRTWITMLGLLQFLAVNAFIRTHPIPMLKADAMLGLSFAAFLYAVVSHRQPIGSRIYQFVATKSSKFSYTLYLVHLPFLTFLTALVIHPWHPWAKSPRHYLFGVLLVVAAYIYAWVLYLIFERNTEAVRTRLTPLFAGLTRARSDAQTTAPR